MADSLLKKYIVGLGFRLDKEGLHRFHEGMKASHASVKSFGLAVVGVMTTIEESVRRTAEKLESLYYTSQRTGVSVRNLKTFSFSLKQIGIDPDAMIANLSQVDAKLRDNPFFKNIAERFAPGLRAGTKDLTDVLKGIAKEYERIGTSQGEAFQAQWLRQVASEMGFDLTLLLQYTKEQKQAIQWQERLDKWLSKIHFDVDKAALEAVHLQHAWGFAWAQVQSSINKFATLTFPLLEEIIKHFIEWMKGPGKDMIKSWSDEFEKWRKDPETIKSIEEKLKAIGRAAVALGRGVLYVLKAFNAVSDVIGPLNTLVLGVFALWIAKAILVQGVIKTVEALLGGLCGGGAKVWLKRIPFIAGLALGYTAMQNQDKPGTHKDEYKSTWQLLKDVFSLRAKREVGGSGAANGPTESLWEWLFGKGADADKVIGPDGKLRAKKVSYLGGGAEASTIALAMYHMLESWLRGGPGFRPLIVIGQDSIDDLVTMMSDRKLLPKLGNAEALANASKTVSGAAERVKSVAGTPAAKGGDKPAGEPPAGSGGAPVADATPAPSPAPSGGGGDLTWAVGDSNAYGLATALGINRDAIGGTTPKQIYERLAGKFKYFAGETVALSSGSNPADLGYNREQMEYVKKTMQAIKEAGGKLVVMGVGSGVKDYQRINKDIAEFAKELKVPYSGELAGTEGGKVHPRGFDYNPAVDQVKRALGSEKLSRAGGRVGDANVVINIDGTGDPQETARAVVVAMGDASADIGRRLAGGGAPRQSMHPPRSRPRRLVEHA